MHSVKGGTLKQNARGENAGVNKRSNGRLEKK